MTAAPTYPYCRECGTKLKDFALCTFCSVAFCSPDCLWDHYLTEHRTAEAEVPRTETGVPADSFRAAVAKKP